MPSYTPTRPARCWRRGSCDGPPGARRKRRGNGLSRVNSIKSVSAPTVTLSLLRSWVNGWPTSGRFHSEAAGCRFGCKGGEDRLEHYCRCSRVVALQKRVLKGIPPARDAQTLFLLVDEAESAARERTAGRALFLHALLGCYNTARSGGRVLEGDGLFNTWRARAQTVLVARPGLQKAIAAVLT